jgi:hypothetical protein
VIDEIRKMGEIIDASMTIGLGVSKGRLIGGKWGPTHAGGISGTRYIPARMKGPCPRDISTL